MAKKDRQQGYNWTQRVLFIPPILLGVMLLALAPQMKASPPQATQTTQKKVVRVLKIAPRTIQPTATGYGHTAPANDWEAQSELEGRVVWVADSLKEGRIIKKDDTLIRLDPSSYQLAIAHLNAELEVSKLKDRTILESMKIAEQEFQVQKSDYDRTQRLHKTGHISNTERDRATSELLGRQQQLQTLKNALAINKAEQQVLETELAMANRDLAHTVISAPFDLRITEKIASMAEYINKGEILLRADAIAAVEVSAQFPLGKMRPLRRATEQDPLSRHLHNELEAVVELKAGDRVIRWQASVDRTGGYIDAQTQSQSIVVRIDNPYQQADPGKKPPLIRDTFVKVTLKAPALKQQIIIPSNAIHNGKVYVVNNEGKLAIKPVKVDFVQGQVAVIKQGLNMGDVVVLSKLSPAVKGMSLKPQPDKNMVEWLDGITGFKVQKTAEDQGSKQSGDKS